MIKILEAIEAINSNAKVVVRGNDIDNCEIEWLEGTSEISKTNIKAKMEKNLIIIFVHVIGVC